MRQEITNLVYPVIQYGLHLKQRLENGDHLKLEIEQAALKGYLQSEMEARRHADFGGDSGVESMSFAGASMQGGDLGRRGRDGFLGIRYALACWLDEIFILDSPWERPW